MVLFLQQSEDESRNSSPSLPVVDMLFQRNLDQGRQMALKQGMKDRSSNAKNLYNFFLPISLNICIGYRQHIYVSVEEIRKIIFKYTLLSGGLV